MCLPCLTCAFCARFVPRPFHTYRDGVRTDRSVTFPATTARTPPNRPTCTARRVDRGTTAVLG